MAMHQIVALEEKSYTRVRTPSVALRIVSLRLPEPFRREPISG